MLRVEDYCFSIFYNLKHTGFCIVVQKLFIAFIVFDSINFCSLCVESDFFLILNFRRVYTLSLFSQLILHEKKTIMFVELKFKTSNTTERKGSKKQTLIVFEKLSII